MSSIDHHRSGDNVAKSKDLSLGDILRVLIKGIRYVRRRWIYLLTACIVGGSLGVILAWTSPITYSAKVSFVLEEGKPSGGGLSALAGQFGFDLGASGGTSILQGDNIIGLLKSRKFTKTALLSSFNGTSISLADKYAEVYNLRNEWQQDPKIGKEMFFPSTKAQASFSRLQDSLLSVIELAVMKKLLVNRSDRKMTFYDVNIDLEDELLSKLFTERLVNNAVEFYIETKTRRQRSNVERLQRRADSIAGLLNYRTYTAAVKQSQVLDVNPAYQTAMVAAEVSSRDKLMIGTIYAEIVKNLEVQKATLTQETPVIQIVDGADMPLKKIRKSRIVYGIVGAFILLGLVLSFMATRTLIRRNL